MKRFGLLFGICAVIASTLIGWVLLSGQKDLFWPDQGAFEQHG